MTIAVLVISFFGLLLIGVPVAVALGAATVFTSLLFNPIPPEIIGQKVLDNVDHFTLMAVPFFFLAAGLMETGGLVRRLVDLANDFVGHLRGGLGMTAVLSCILFAAISGSSPATVAAVGRVMYPSLVREGYSPRYAIGALATAGSLGILIPPSIPMILYGFVTETSITHLFMAGVVPGLMYGAGLMLMAYLLADRAGPKLQPRASLDGPRGQAESGGAGSVPPGVHFRRHLRSPGLQHLGLFVCGWCDISAPTEAAVMAAALALFIGIVIYREMTLRTAVDTVLATAPTIGMVFFITTNALLFAFFITQLGIPQALANFLTSMHTPAWLFLLMVNILLIIVGFFLEGTPTVLMFVPILFPAAKQLGIDPVHFCVIVVVNIELGLIHPPVGLNLFVGSAISGLPVMQVFYAVLPWMCVTVATLLLVTYVPEISLFLPRLLLG